MLAEQIRRAPWLALSAVAHALLLVLAWVLIPPAPPQAAPKAVALAPIEDLTPPETPEIIPPEPIVEPTPTEVEVREPTISEPSDAESLNDAVSDAPADSEATTEADVRNLTIGLFGPPPGGPKGTGRGVRGSKSGGPLSPIGPALAWLAKHQDADGRWDADGFMKHDVDGEPCDGVGNPVHDVGVTALALMAFVGDGNSMRSGPYRETVRRAVSWLKDQQGPDGRFGPGSSSDFIYDHAIAAYAMCEAYGYSQYKLLAPVAQRGIDYLQAHRNPYGAWRYQPRDGDNDTSVTCWAIMALSSAQHWGLTVDRAALQAAEVFLDSCTSADGHLGYSRAGEASARKPGDHGARFPVDKTEALTAAGLFCRFFLGQDPKEQPCMRAAVDRILAKKPSWDAKSGSIDHYYWYYASYALYQMGGRAWSEWSKALDLAVVKTQRKDGNFAGSWDPSGAWGEDGGRVYSTAILALTLEAYYRYGRLVPLAGR
jgi:hypothetical protein